jgi:hypothetical protein
MKRAILIAYHLDIQKRLNNSIHVVFVFNASLLHNKVIYADSVSVNAIGWTVFKIVWVL